MIEWGKDMLVNEKTGRRQECYLCGGAEFFRRLVYQKISGRFPLLQKMALSLRREGWQVTYHKVKNRLWPGIRRKLSPKGRGALKNMDIKTYLPPSEIDMKVEGEELRKKLREFTEEMARKL